MLRRCLALPRLASPLPTDTITPEPTLEYTLADEWDGVVLGMLADDVLKIHPKSETIAEPEQIGADSEGLIVKWFYPGVDLVFARREIGGIYGYRVVEIRIK